MFSTCAWGVIGLSIWRHTLPENTSTTCDSARGPSSRDSLDANSVGVAQHVGADRWRRVASLRPPSLGGTVAQAPTDGTLPVDADAVETEPIPDGIVV